MQTNNKKDINEKYKYMGGFVRTERNYKNGELNTLQLAVGRRCLIFHIGYYSEFFTTKPTMWVYYRGTPRQGCYSRRTKEIMPSYKDSCMPNGCKYEKTLFTPKATKRIIKKFMKFEERQLKRKELKHAE